jgi:hypothetical protein
MPASLVTLLNHNLILGVKLALMMGYNAEKSFRLYQLDARKVLMVSVFRRTKS